MFSPHGIGGGGGGGGGGGAGVALLRLLMVYCLSLTADRIHTQHPEHALCCGALAAVWHGRYTTAVVVVVVVVVVVCDCW